MSCLIYASNGEHCIGKCDANCYNATGGKCDCICNGKNHGVGINKARENTAKHVDEWIELYKQKHSKAEVTVNGNEVFQLKLFNG